MSQTGPPTVWNVSPAEAREIQERLRDRVRIETLDLDSVRTVAGADLSSEWHGHDLFAAFVVLRRPELDVVVRSGASAIARFPYIPGLLSFRETPPLLQAWEKLETKPDALLYDGQGLAHPRRFGIACHLGILLDVPTIGCAKSILVGEHEPVGASAGQWSPLVHKDEVIGAALRTRDGVAPVYISVGHRVDLESAIRLVLACVGKARIPEPTRQAHLFVNELRRTVGP